MDNNTENLIKNLQDATSQATSLATQFHLQFETMAELQKDERDQMRKHYEGIVQKYTRIIFGLIAALIIILGGIIGGAIYLLSNYDLSFSTYQELDMGGDGNQNVYDGIHMNTPD